MLVSEKERGQVFGYFPALHFYMSSGQIPGENMQNCGWAAVMEAA